MWKFCDGFGLLPLHWASGVWKSIGHPRDKIQMHSRNQMHSIHHTWHAQSCLSLSGVNLFRTISIFVELLASNCVYVCITGTGECEMLSAFFDSICKMHLIGNMEIHVRYLWYDTHRLFSPFISRPLSNIFAIFGTKSERSTRAPHKQTPFTHSFTPYT